MKWVINGGTGELEPTNSAKLKLGQRFDLGGLAKMTNPTLVKHM